MTIGDRIKNRRKFLQMSAEELAKRIGKDRSTVFRYEKGDIENLPLDILEPIAKALETTPQYLMGWDNEEQPTTNGELSEKKKKIIERVKLMNDAELDRLDKILSLVENTNV